MSSANRLKLKQGKIYLLIFCFLGLGCKLLFPTEKFLKNDRKAEDQNVYRIYVPANQNWTDTGLDVVQNQMIFFEASGGICLQEGNPIAHCGPDGYQLKTVQQPLQDQNIGALIGKVVQLISVEIDEETGEEIRHELVKEFYIGSARRVAMPLSGRLFLGINENLAGDNSGEFKVIIYLIDKNIKSE